MDNRAFENEAIYALTQHRGWATFKKIVDEEITSLLRKLLTAKKEDSFRDVQGAVKSLNKLMNYVQSRCDEITEKPAALEKEILHERV